MLTYESVWLENDQLLKVKEFIQSLGIERFTIQCIPEEGVSTITVPEISSEHWNLVEDFEYSLLRGDWEAEKENPTSDTALQKLQNNLAKGLFGQTKQEAQNRTICISCNKPIYVKYADCAEAPGHIYSVAGENEYSITGLCEYCFDQAFDETVEPGEREIEEFESYTLNS